MKNSCAIAVCAKWLSFCLEIGWDKKQLDALEALWWKHHDDDGNLIEAMKEESHETHR